MAEKHTVHLREGGKVIIDETGRVELHLDGPLVFHRKCWVKYLQPSEEANRAVAYSNLTSPLTRQLAEAFTAVPIIVHREED